MRLLEDVAEEVTASPRRIGRIFRNPSLFKSYLPWNALLHRIRWELKDPDSLEKWTDRKLNLGSYSWVFVVGSNNSGTTLLFRLLSRSGKIRGLPREGGILTKALPRSSREGLPRLFGLYPDVFRWTESDVLPKRASQAKYDWSRFFENGPGHLLVKSPEDTMRTRWLQANFQPIRFIVIVRSAYAVCEGIRRRGGHNIRKAASHWAAVNQTLVDDLPYLEKNLFLSYSDFCSAPKRFLREILEFLDLEPGEADYILSEKLKVHNIDDSSCGIRNFNPESIAALSRDDISEINSICGPLMRRLGYELLS